MKKLASSTLLVGLAVSAVAFSNGKDPLAELQWGLRNTGREISEELTDFKSKIVKSVPGMDIGASQSMARFAELKKKTVVVAVIDSGLDIEHPDLAEHVFVNEADCDTGNKVPFKPDEDKDSNGFKGDCKGWNVSGVGDENRVNDDTGHGTHVAGIIGAIGGNARGIEGAVPDVKILPIKLTHAKDTGVKLADRVEAALKYAIAMKVDVINMSLGWPSSSDRPSVRDAFRAAVQQGIAIVVAAGNNTTNKPFFPCAYEEVICVGSITADGTASAFSNFGSHIDFMAPGSKIISLFPTAKTPTGGITLKGYDYKNGTSQAAPYVASAAAILKSFNPEISVNEIRARLAASSKRVKADSIDGLVQVDKAVSTQPQVVLRPLIKGARLSKVDENGRFEFEIGVTNLWTEAKAVRLKLTAPQGVTLSQSDFAIGAMASGESRRFKIPATVLDISRDQKIEMSAEVLNEEKSVYKIEFVETLISAADTSREGEVLTLDTGDQLPTSLETVRALGVSLERPEFFSQSEKDEATSIVNLYTPSGSAYRKISLELPKVEMIYQFIKMDLNLDGKQDYFLFTLEREGEGSNFKLRYLTSELKPLYDFSYATYEAVNAVINFTQLTWVPSKYKTKSIMVPAFLNSGTVSPHDQVKDPFETHDDAAERTRLFYLEPGTTVTSGKMNFKVRTLDHYYEVESIRKKIGAGARDLIRFYMVIPQSPAELKSATSKLIMVKHSNSPKYYEIELATGPKIKSIQEIAGQFDLQGYREAKKPIAQNSSKSFFLSRQQNTQIVEFAVLNGLSQPRFFTYRHGSLGDSIMGVVAAMEDGDGYTFVIETKIRLIAARFEKSGKSIVAETPIHRTSLLSSRIFSELFVPVAINSKPGVYVDASQIFAGQIYSVTLENGKFIPSIENSRIVNQGCEALNPHVKPNRETSFVLFCKDAQAASLRFIPMK